MAIEKVSSGDPFKPSAAMHNATVDLINAHNRKALSKGVPVPGSGDKEICSRIRMQNVSAANRRRGEVLKLGDLATTEIDIARMQVFEGSVPTNSTDTIAVLLEAVPYNSETTGLAQLMGVVPAIVDIQTEGDEWASVEHDSPVLVSGSTGKYKILHAPTGTGEKDCIILLDRAGVDGVLFRNDSGYTVPPHGVMQVYRIQGPTGLVEIVRPDGTFDNNHLFLVNGPTEVLDGEESRGTWLTDAAGKVLTKASLSTTADRFFAPKANYWHLEQNSDTGYEAMGFICFTRGTLSTEPSYSYDYGSGATTATYYHCIQQVEHPELSLDGGGSALLMYDSSGSTVTTLDCTVPRLQAYIGGIMQSQISYRAGLDMTNADPYDNGTFQLVRDGYYQLDFQLRGHFTSSGAYEYDETYDVSPSGTVTVTHPRGDISHCVSLEMEICIDDVGNTPSDWTTIYKENMSPFSIIDRHIQYYFFGANGKKVVLRLTLADTYNQAKFYLYQSGSPVSDQYSRYKVTRLRNSAFIG